MFGRFETLRFLRKSSLLIAVPAGVVGCHSAPPFPTGISMTLSSPSFTNGKIPAQYSSCSGQSNISPALSWGATPAGTKSLALIVYDQDSPLGANLVHWMLYDLPPGRTGLPEGVSKQADLPDGSRQGRNGLDDVGYTGPCPPGHTAHHYVFDLYALDTNVNLVSASTEPALMKALEGHVIAGGHFTAVFER